jgi:photosystem II stability/assembly factor-like uncharacterized protein
MARKGLCSGNAWLGRLHRTGAALIAVPAFVVGFACGPAQAAVDSAAWQSVGPAPPAIEAAIVADPATHTIYIASTGGGVLKSTNEGASFKPVNTGLDALSITAMAMDPRDSDVVYVSTLSDVYKTTDGGASWHKTNGPAGVVTFAMDPSNPDVIYSGSSPNGGVNKTTNGGLTWAAASNGIGVPAVFALAIKPGEPNVVFAGTAGFGAFRSTDGGSTWQPLSIDSTVWSLLVDPVDDDVVYAGSNGTGVYASRDGGKTFARVGAPDVGVVLALARSGPYLYAGTATGGVSVSSDSGATWRNTGVSAGLGLVLSTDSTGAVYAGTNFDGAFVHRALPVPPGATEFSQSNWRRLGWNVLSKCACQNGHALSVDPGDHRHVFLTTNDGGLLVTRDGGKTWRDGGKNGLFSRAPRGIAFDPQDPQRVYVGGFTSMGFFKSDDNGEHWQLRQFGSNAIYTTGVSVDAANHAVFVATLNGEGVWKSTDFGDTFTRVDRAPGAPPNTYLGLAGRGITADPRISGTVYVAASRGKSAGIWRSQDGGATFVRVNGTPTLSITVDPADSNVVYAATPASGVLKSIDGGTSFNVKSAGLPTNVQTSRAGSVQVNPLNPNVLYVGTEGGGVFKSMDAAESWSPVSDGLDDPNVYGLVLDPQSPDVVYAATARSVFRTTTSGQ